VHEDEARKSYADLEKFWCISTGYSPSARPPSSGQVIARPEEAAFVDAAANEKMIGRSRMQSLLLRNSSRISSIFRSHAYERSELVRRYAIEVESLCNSREKIMHKFMDDARSSLMKTKQIVDAKVTQHVGASVHVQKPHGKSNSPALGSNTPSAEQTSIADDSMTKTELVRLRAVLKDLREFGRKIKTEHADIKNDNENLVQQLEELKASKATISDTISGAMASIQGGTALSSEILDRNRSNQSLTSQAQTNQLRKQCDMLKNENLKLLNTKSQVLRDVRSLVRHSRPCTASLSSSCKARQFFSQIYRRNKLKI
jgi:paraquat-inducible protein B